MLEDSSRAISVEEEQSIGGGDEEKETRRRARTKSVDEKRLKRQYYLSDPLKSYAQHKGESILPKKKLLLDDDDQEIRLDF